MLKTHAYFAARTITDVQCVSHIHYNSEFVCVREGTLTVGTKAGDYILTAGKALFIPPYMPHSFEAGSRSQTLIVEYSRDVLPRRYYGGMALFAVPPATVRQLDTLCSLGSDEGRLAVLYTLHALLNKEQNRLGFGVTDATIGRVQTYLEEHYEEPITLRSVAAHFNLNYSYLSRRFRETVGVPFSVCLNNERIYQVNQQLLATDRPVSEIALACGFNNLRSFNKAYRSAMGCTPTELRHSRLL